MLDPQSQQIALTAKGEAYAVAHRASRRAELESEIERLIDMLDAIDGDPDLEPDGTEMDTSWTDRGPQALHGASIDEGDEQDADGEPTLGAPEATLWPAGFYRSVATAPRCSSTSSPSTLRRHGLAGSVTTTSKSTRTAATFSTSRTTTTTRTSNSTSRRSTTPKAHTCGVAAPASELAPALAPDCR